MFIPKPKSKQVSSSERAEVKQEEDSASKEEKDAPSQQAETSSPDASPTNAEKHGSLIPKPKSKTTSASSEQLPLELQHQSAGAEQQTVASPGGTLEKSQQGGSQESGEASPPKGSEGYLLQFGIEKWTLLQEEIIKTVVSFPTEHVFLNAVGRGKGCALLYALSKILIQNAGELRMPSVPVLYLTPSRERALQVTAIWSKLLDRAWKAEVEEEVSLTQSTGGETLSASTSTKSTKDNNKSQKSRKSGGDSRKDAGSKIPNPFKTFSFVAGSPEKNEVNYLTLHLNDISSTQPFLIGVGTPGRLLSHITNGVLDPSQIQYLVIDEVDVTLTVPTRNDTQKIFTSAPIQKRCFFINSNLEAMDANLTSTVQKFLQPSYKMVSDPPDTMMSLSSRLHSLPSFDNVSHVCVNAPEDKKIRTLSVILGVARFQQCMVFVANKDRAEMLNKLLTELGVPSVCIHPQVPSDQRTKAFQDFEALRAQVLVSTDCLTKSALTFQQCNTIIHFDVPENSVTYFQRLRRMNPFLRTFLVIALANENDVTICHEIHKITPFIPLDVSAGAEELAKSLGAICASTEHSENEDHPHHMERRRSSLHRKGSRRGFK